MKGKRFERGYCPHCGGFKPIRKDGFLFSHGETWRPFKCINYDNRPLPFEEAVKKFAVVKR